MMCHQYYQFASTFNHSSFWQIVWQCKTDIWVHMQYFKADQSSSNWQVERLYRGKVRSAQVQASRLNVQAPALHDRLLVFKEGGFDRSIGCFLSPTEIRHQSISRPPHCPPSPVPACHLHPKMYTNFCWGLLLYEQYSSACDDHPSFPCVSKLIIKINNCYSDIQGNPRANFNPAQRGLKQCGFGARVHANARISEIAFSRTWNGWKIKVTIWDRFIS